MKIIKLDIPKDSDNKDGLEQIKMDKLGPVVLIAGKNGSGKTRILNKIFKILTLKPKYSVVMAAQAQVDTWNKRISRYQSELDKSKEQSLAGTHLADVISLENRMIHAKRNIEVAKTQVSNYEEVLNWKHIETDSLKDEYSSVYFVPKELNLSDCSTYPKNRMLQFANSVNDVGVSALPQGVFAKIQVIQDRWFNATHQQSQIDIEEKATAIENYNKLNQLIGIFLNTSIGRTIDDEATLFGFSLGKSRLSDGQKILLQFCLAIYSQEIALKDLIIILDEPENHLHPSVIIETIDRIQKCASDGQIWIATHSIPLLAHFDPSLIWYVEDSRITHAGKIPEKVLYSLLGNDSEISKLQDFINLPSQYATSRYAFESLFEPSAVITGSNDPQSFQIRADLLKRTSTGKLRILDYGAGKGRLISNIVDLDGRDQQKLIESIDYIAYDKYTNDKEHCENALIKAYGSSYNRCFTDFNSLLAVYDKGTFDVVIMCNVLHEIDPKDWLKLFQTKGIISSLLSESGVLLLVEDHQIPIGEKAYQKGFLVLDTPQLKDLFKILEKDSDFTFSERKNGRLKAHQIPKRLLTQIDENSRLAAILSVSETAKEKILEIREKEKDYQNGKLHGFWTQQFANAQLNLAEFTTTK